LVLVLGEIIPINGCGDIIGDVGVIMVGNVPVDMTPGLYIIIGCIILGSIMGISIGIIPLLVAYC
jgi:hypothetical protein